MVKPPARPLIRCAPVCLAAALVIGGVALPGVALPGVALAARGATCAEPARPPGIPFAVPGIEAVPEIGLPTVEGVPPHAESLLPTAGWAHLDPLRPVALPLPVLGLVGAAQPVDPDGWSDPQEPPDEPAPDAVAPDEPPPGEEAPDDPPAAPEVPVPPAAPARPTAAAPQATNAAPRPAPASPAPRRPRKPRPTPSPADTRGLDERFPDRPSTDTPEAGGPRDSSSGPGAADYAGPLIYSGIAGMLVSAIGIGVVLNRRRGW